MRMCSIASGSSGNCIYVGSDNTHLLVDTGISKKRIEEGLKTLDLKGNDLNGILITHEHSDHISGLGVIARRYGLPIYGTKGTLEAIANTPSVGKIDPSLYRVLEPDMDITIGEIVVHPIRISHDAADPVAYILKNENHKIAIITDLGIYDDYLIEKLQGLDILLLEANHDVRMLEAGSYPYPLKRRILGERGHLSNEVSGQLLGELLMN